jgi:integrase
MLHAARTPRERRAIYLGICAGLRNAELRGLQGRHLARAGWVWVSAEIAKGNRERWVPAIPELEPVIAEIRENVDWDEYVLPAQRFRDVGSNLTKLDKAKHPSSSQALRSLVQRVGKQAGIRAEINPHAMRHAYGDLIARYAGMRTAQFLLGHAGIATTEAYTGAPTLDELREAVSGFGVFLEPNAGSSPLLRRPLSPPVALTETKPVEWADRALARVRGLFSGSLSIGRPRCV